MMANPTNISHSPPTIDLIADTLAPFGVTLSQNQLAQIQTYIQLLLEWNRTLNLTAITDPNEIIARHFGESLFAASLLKIGSGRLADVGTGAGFPGLPLKIICPDAKITLIESNSRKCAFLTEVVQRLGLEHVAIQRGRYEETSRDAKFDFVCARAVGDYHILLPWARRALLPDGRLVLWLGTDDSIRIARRKEFLWEIPVPIPSSRRRLILVGRPNAAE